MSNAIAIKTKRAILTVAVSSRALFHLEDENKIFEEQGEEAFNRYMAEHENEVLKPGAAFPLVKKLLMLNSDGLDRVEVVMLSRNSPVAGLRVMRSVREHGMFIEKAVFSRGKDRFRYAKAMGSDLFLSATHQDVVGAIQDGVAAATMVPRVSVDDGSTEVRLAFDGDSVIFGGCADKVFREVGLDEWRKHEEKHAMVPLSDGPFKAVIEKLHKVQKSLGPENAHKLRLALITARGAPAHERALRTMLGWGVEVDEAVFAAGMPKGPLVRAYGADAFFDDGISNINSVAECNIAAGLVPTRMDVAA